MRPHLSKPTTHTHTTPPQPPPPNTPHRQDITSSRQRYVFGDSQLARLNSLLSQYEGTHNYHNYTVSGHTSTALRGARDRGWHLGFWGRGGELHSEWTVPAALGGGSHCHGLSGW